jgi:hypothetical protein
MSSRCIRIVVTACALSVVATIATAQGRGNPNPLRMITKTIYTPRTEFFAVYRPYVVGQEGRLTAHMSRITDRFEAYPENAQLTLTLTVGGATIERSKPDAIERSGHFAFAFTPTVAGRGTATVVLTTPGGTERFVIDNIVVEPDLPTAIAHQGAAPPPDGSIRYSKEAAWDGRFLTTPATKMVLASGKTPALAVSKGAIVQIEGQPHVYVQRDPEAFYLRLVKTGENNDRYVAVTDGVREGERVVTLGAEKMPRK